MIQHITRMDTKRLSGKISTPRIIQILKSEDFDTIDLRDGRVMCFRFKAFQDQVYVNETATRLLRQKYPQLMIKVYGDCVVFATSDMTMPEQRASEGNM